MTRDPYPLLERPLPRGLATLAEYAQRVGRSKDYIRTYWRPRPGFPDPVGKLAAQGRNGGGRGELVWKIAALDAFRASQHDLWGRRTTQLLVTSRNMDERMTLGYFADNVAEVHRKTITQYRGQSGFPAAGDDGKYRLGDLVDWWNHGRPGKRGPAAKAQAA
jgi:hypothetical protein